MNLQEIFDKSGKKMLEQGCRSWAGNSYLYKDYEGRCCAVGALFTADTDTSAFEGKSVFAAESDEGLCAALKAGGVDAGDKQTLSLLHHLQCIHDEAPKHADAEQWQGYLLHEWQAVANSFKLSMDVLKKRAEQIMQGQQ